MTTICATLAGISVMAMMKTNDSDDPDSPWLDKPGIVLRAPHHLSPARAIPLKIDVEADTHTDDALRGFLVGAISLVLVRQDRPGILIGAAYNPHQIGYPPEHFGLSDAPSSALGLSSDSSDSPRERPDPRNTSGETIEYQLGAGVVDRGSGRYFLLGGFAKWWAAPQVIHISDPAGPAPVEDRPLPVAATVLAPPWVPPLQPVLEIGELGGRRFLRVVLPPPPPSAAASAHAGSHAAKPIATPAKPFFTIVGFHLKNTGGAAGAVFAPKVPAGAESGAIEATVSFASFHSDDLVRRTIAGAWAFLLFYGDQVSQPLNVTLVKTDS